jgi:hypothetical protein
MSLSHLAPTSAALASTLGFYIEERAGTQVLVYLSQGCHPASDAEFTLWTTLLASARSRTALHTALTRFFDNALLSKDAGDEASVCIDCYALSGGPHTAACEVDRLRLALNKSTQEQIS